MVIKPYSKEELWSPKPYQLPKRSRLNHLIPIAVNTPMVECLTSYLTRLAESHSILISALITKELAPILTKDFTQYGSKKALNALFNCGVAINSTGEIVELFLDTLNKLTLKQNLSALTLMPFKNYLSSRELLSKTKTWCPDCYQDWKRANKTIYEPLLWTLSDVRVCSIHKRILKDLCPNCNRQIPWFTAKSRVGYCCYCQKWLGDSSKSQKTDSCIVSKQNLVKDIWITNTFGQLITCSEKLNSNNQPNRISLSISKVINITHEDNIAAFARTFNLPKNTVWMWHKGKSIPQLKHILNICYCLNISLFDFLNPNDFELVKIDSQKLPTKISIKRVSPRNLDVQKIEKFLKSVIKDRDSRAKTLKEVAETLAIDPRTLSRHFPELCKAISNRHRRYKAKDTNDKINKCCQEVKRAVAILHEKGEYPSEARVSKLISQPGHFRYKKVRKALEEAKSNISFKA